MHSFTTEFVCLGDSTAVGTNDNSVDPTQSQEFKENWEKLCAGYVATGATLGVMAVVLLLFLFMLCLPWSKCRRLQRYVTRQQTSTINTRRANPLEQETFDYYYPLSILDLFPPSMLPKLPDYDECIRDGIPTSPDDAPPPATPPPSVVAGDRLQTGVSAEHQTINSNAGSDSATPPPSYSSTQSPLDSGEPISCNSTPMTGAVTQDSQLTSSVNVEPNE